MIRRSIRLIVPALLLVLIMACASTSETGEPALALTYEKTPCFGRCPVFKLKVFKDGSARFEGMANIDRRGLFRCSDCTPEMLVFIQQQAKELGFNQLEDRYDPGVKDLPETITTLYKGKRGKSVVNVMDAPENLVRLEVLIDSVYDQATWELLPR